MGKVSYTYEINNDSTPSGTDFQQNYDDLDAVVDGALLEDNFSPETMIPVDLNFVLENVDDNVANNVIYWKVKFQHFGYILGWLFYAADVNSAGTVYLFKNPSVSSNAITGEQLDSQFTGASPAWKGKEFIERVVPGDVLAIARLDDGETLDLDNVSVTIPMLVKKR